MKYANDAISSIGLLSMDCFNRDDVIKSLEYDRTAVGTRTSKVTSHVDSSGDIFKFCTGLYEKMLEVHGDRFMFIPDTIVDSFMIKNISEVEAVNLIDSNGTKQMMKLSNVVISAGSQSYDLCQTLGIPCPIFPVKGYIITFHSKKDINVNLLLGKSKAFVSPMGNDKYHLSGCAEFLSHYNNTQRAYDIDQVRVNALIDEARTVFTDMKVQNVDCGFRPLSPDDIPLVGGTTKFENVFLNTGSGSKGWTQGPGCGRLLSEIMLGLEVSVDPSAYSPRRFDWSWPFLQDGVSSQGSEIYHH